MLKQRLLFVILLVPLLLTACQGGEGGAVQAVTDYYQALVDRNDARYVGYTCAEWEEMALLEYDSFAGVDISLEGLSCRETGTQGDARLVACDGKIQATYGNEQMEFPLADRLHKVVKEEGDWRVCGY